MKQTIPLTTCKINYFFSIMKNIRNDFLIKKNVHTVYETKQTTKSNVYPEPCLAFIYLFIFSDSVREQNEEVSCTLDRLKQILIECLAGAQQTQRKKISLSWTRVASIIDVTFLILYIITITIFLSVLGKVWSYT